MYLVKLTVQQLLLSKLLIFFYRHSMNFIILFSAELFSKFLISDDKTCHGQIETYTNEKQIAKISDAYTHEYTFTV